jgi:hypothetical protein
VPSVQQQQLQQQTDSPQLHEQQQVQQQVGVPVPPAVLQPSSAAGSQRPGSSSSSSTDNGSDASAGSDELQEQQAAAREQAAPPSSRHSSSASGSGSEGDHTGQPSGVSSSTGTSSSNSGSGSNSEYSEEDASQQPEASDGGLVPFTGPVSSTAAVPLQPPQQQAVAAANVLTAARSWLVARCQALAHSVLRAGVSAVSNVASSAAGAVSVRLSGLLPPPALHSITITSGRLDYVVWGEPLERTVQDVAMRLTLGPGYSWLDILIDGDAVPRHPASTKITLMNPNAKRHLRHVTPGTAGANRLRRFTCDTLPPAQPELVQPLPQQEQGHAAGDGKPYELLDAVQAAGAAAGAGAGESSDSEVAAENAADLAQQQQQQQQQQYSSPEDDEELESVLQLEGVGSRIAGARDESRSSSVSRQQGGSSRVAAPEPDVPAVVPAGTPGLAAAVAALPLETLHIPSGQQCIPSRVHFQLPEELHAWQQQQATGTDAAQQTGRRAVPDVTQVLRHLQGRTAQSCRSDMLGSMQ